MKRWIQTVSWPGSAVGGSSWSVEEARSQPPFLAMAGPQAPRLRDHTLLGPDFHRQRGRRLVLPALASQTPDMTSYAYTRVQDGDEDSEPTRRMSTKRPPYFGLTGDRLSGWVTVACTTAMVLFGYDQGVFGGIIITPDFLETMGNPNPSLQGAIVALYDIGCLFGALAAMFVGERLGRRKTFLVGVSIMSVGALMQTCSYTVIQMIVARIITGLGNGMNTATAPVWESETCKPSRRGKLVVFEMVMNIAGFAVSNWMTYGFSFAQGSVSWRFPIAFQLAFSVVLFATIPWLPESPRWLLMHGFEDEGAAVLAALHGEGATAQDAVIVDQKMEILEAVRMEKDISPSWSDILHMRTGETGMLQRLLLGAGAQLMQQLVGINVTSYYLPLVLQNSVGLSNNLARLLAACNSITYLLFAFFGIVLIERAGRRKLMMSGAVGQAGCYIAISYCLAFAGPEDRRYGAAATFFFFAYYLFFGVCWQGVPWLYPVEINSLAMRTKGAALATATNWLSNYLIVEVTPPGIAAMGWRFYLVWMVFNVLFVPVVWLFYPETANRHLEDVDWLYRDNPRMVVVLGNEEAVQLERPQRFVEAELRRAGRAPAAEVGDVDLEVTSGDHLRKRT
ncbi:Hexose carrier protein [Mycena chlorophos]|uniref:Hexose carrier protein n=1 Tax=Mycena chlorophos TaxID=658473 RepID=A0A8H6WAM8_MYCCL|nr:Hexose carrier protein [Mycena chlorophos]